MRRDLTVSPPPVRGSAARRLRPVALLFLFCSVPACRAVPAEPVETIQVTDDEAAALADSIGRVMADRVDVVEGLRLELWAGERMMIDPHALAVDERGAVYVASSGRTRVQRAVNQRFRSRLAATLKYRSVEDLRTFLRTELAPDRSEENHEWLPDLNADSLHDWRDLAMPDERVYRLQDTSGDGRADLSQVIVEDFGSEVTDIVGGLLVHEGDVYVGAAPGVWRMRDVSGDGIPEVKETISEGYGVRLGFFGHGMSGLTLGPDGRVYWSIGDVGLNVVDREGKRWEIPDRGAILRSEPDGSNFEVFASGVRNVYEFAFDEHGNLIGADNDGDQPGEHERLVYLVEGSDSGWRTNWQYGKYTDPLNNDYRVWMAEGLHAPRTPDQPAYITPPISLSGNGPAGMVYNPGTALGERWRDHFFLAEAKGSASRVRAFTLTSKGAGFELASDTVVLDEGILTTSMDFGADGALYLADLVFKIKPELGGRIWRLDDPAAAGSPLRARTEELLAAPFESLSATELSEILAHPDMRLRMKAQFELVEREESASLAAVAERGKDPLARLHAIWGLGQLGRRNASEVRILVPLLGDGDAEVRAQAAKVIGEAGYAPAGDALVPLLRDEAPRVRFFAAQALGQLRHAAAVQPLIEMLAANKGKDVYLRHAGSLALARIGDADALTALARHPSRALRIAAVVALRRMRNPGVAVFLGDPDALVVAEAARAINDDGGIEQALPALAELLDDERLTGEPLLRRVINANLRLGTPEGLRRVARYAARERAPVAMRVEAISGLGAWAQPSEFDRVDGGYRGPVANRDAAAAVAVVQPLVDAGLTPTSPEGVRAAIAGAAGLLKMREAMPSLLDLLRTDPSATVRLASLEAIVAMEGAQTEEAVRVALADTDDAVRERALVLTTRLKLSPSATARLLTTVVEDGSIPERQAAITGLGGLAAPEARQTLERLVGGLMDGTLAPELELDVMEAVRSGDHPALRGSVDRLLAERSAEGMVAGFADVLRGGNALSGRQIVRRHIGAQCLQCHSVGEAGSTVGPDLRGVGTRLGRREVLQALLEPSARLAPGYGQPGEPSIMPPMGSILSRRELRDVVEYLSTFE